MHTASPAGEQLTVQFVPGGSKISRSLHLYTPIKAFVLHAHGTVNCTLGKVNFNMTAP